MQNSTYDQRTGDTGTLGFGGLTTATLGGLKAGAGRTLALQNASAAAVSLTIGGNGQTNTYAGALTGPGSLTKTGAGIQTLSGTNTYAGSTTVSGGTLLVNGSLGGSGVTVAASGALGGTGTLTPSATVSGTLRPGNNGIGTLTVGGTATLSGSALLELDRTLAPTNDRLAGSSIVLGGTLTVTNLGGTLQSGDTFVLFSGSLSGSIAPVSLPPLLPGLSWDTSALNTAGTIAVTGTVIPPTPPGFSGWTYSGGTLALTGTNGTPGSSYYLLNSTNVALPLTNWVRLSTNQFAADGKFTNAIPVSLTTPQSYFSLQLPSSLRLRERRNRGGCADAGRPGSRVEWFGVNAQTG
jgi:autotransporter-associated beta strand protein